MSVLTIIGGGSTYSPELMQGVLDRHEELGLERVVLQDVREDRLGPVGGFCQRMAERAGGHVEVSTATDLDTALEGADFVVVQIRVGGQEGRHADIQLGLERDIIGQETTGVGGFAKALRTIPVVLDIARRVEERCPDAWLLNFTNPSGMVTEAVMSQGHQRVVGLCNVPVEMHMEIAAVVGRPVEDIELDWVGLNHLGWCRRVLVDGVDVLPQLIDQIEVGVAGPANLPELSYPKGFLRALGMIPSSYVRFFYATAEMYAEIAARKLTRAQEVMALEEQLLDVYRDPASNELPALLSQRGGAWYSRLAVDVMAALTRDEPTLHIVNTLNGTSVPDLPANASVEVPCRISRAGIEPQPCGEVEESIVGLMRAVKSYERLAIEAAVDKSRTKALLALLANPLVPDAATASDVLAALVARGLI